MQAYCPSTLGVAGAQIGAKLISKAGSLEKLALMPSSTIQILGAEKALFQSKKKRSRKTPKYGYLYNHPTVRSTKAANKGKMARVIAGKIAIAAKRDFFKGKDISKDLKQELETTASALK